MTLQQFKQRLDEKTDNLRSIEEVLMARHCFDQGQPVHLTQKAIEDRRAGIAQ